MPVVGSGVDIGVTITELAGAGSKADPTSLSMGQVIHPTDTSSKQRLNAPRLWEVGFTMRLKFLDRD